MWCEPANPSPPGDSSSSNEVSLKRQKIVTKDTHFLTAIDAEKKIVGHVFIKTKFCGCGWGEHKYFLKYFFI